MNTLLLDGGSFIVQAAAVGTDIAVTIASGEQSEVLTDEALLRGVCAGAEAWGIEKLYERYHGYVYALVYRILNNEAMAEDVVQEVFVTLWHKASYYQEARGSVKHWLQTIAHNCAIDKMRSWYTHNANCVNCVQWQEQPQWEPQSHDPELWEQAWQNERAALVRRALAQLPAEQRLVIELSYFSGYTHVEIARRLQIALGTVKGRMRLGLQKMRMLLQSYGAEVARE
jgi:RNA polymerase sigma-70 factor (ECF subfamily)